MVTMAGISHEDMLQLGKTVMPMRMENMKELVGSRATNDRADRNI